MKELFVVYEQGHLDEAERRAKGGLDCAIASFDYWLERELKKRGVPAVPLTEFRTPWTDFSDPIAHTETAARQWYRLPETAFFTHRGLSLGEMFEAVMALHFQGVLSYLLVFEKILDANPGLERLVIPRSGAAVPQTGGMFARFETRLVADVGVFCARRRGVACELVGEDKDRGMILFPPQPRLRALLLRSYNALIRAFAPRRPLKILVSDHWRNISPFIEKMNDAELVFVDRKELRNIPLRQLWKHRVRFIHPLDLEGARLRELAREKQKEFAREWKRAKPAVAALPDFTTDGINWFSVVEPVFDTLVEEYAERVVADIESIRLILEQENINRSLVRASISGQHHFYIMGELPRSLGVPSIEVQHGIGVGILDPHSAFGQMHVDYIAAYGPLVQRAFVKTGYAAERIVPTGSPRFDRYIREREHTGPDERAAGLRTLDLDPEKPVALVIMQEETPHLALGAPAFDSYEFRDFALALRNIQKQIPGLQYILKFRSAALQEKYRPYLEELFTDGGAVPASGDAFPLVLASDFVYACFSTLASECLMARKPTILFPLKKGDTYFYNAHKDGMLTVPLIDDASGLPVREVIEVTQKLIGDKAFYAEAVRKGERYLAENFTFDGRAADRVADFIRRVRKD